MYVILRITNRLYPIQSKHGLKLLTATFFKVGIVIAAFHNYTGLVEIEMGYVCVGITWKPIDSV